MDRETFKAEILRIFEDMDQEGRSWVVQMAREMIDDIRADLILQEALGPDYEPLDPSTWTPSCPPPGV